MVTQAPLRVLVVDDSAYNRKNIADILTGSDDIEVVGKAGDGDEALRLASQLKPDAITLDLEMPQMDGFTFLRILMAKQPTPVIVVSSYSQQGERLQGARARRHRLRGQTRPPVPAGPGDPRTRSSDKVLLVRSLRPLAAPIARAASPGALARPGHRTARLGGAALRGGDRVVDRRALGAARGVHAPAGALPRARSSSLSTCPTSSPAPSPSASTRRARCAWSRRRTTISVTARRAYVCPGKQCMEVTGPSVASIASSASASARPPPTDRYCPSGDRLFKSIATVAGLRAIGVILTGMGDDGVAGAKAIRAAGGIVIAESEETAVVYGMPGAAVRAGVVSEELPLSAIGDYLAGLT